MNDVLTRFHKSGPGLVQPSERLVLRVHVHAHARAAKLATRQQESNDQ